VRLVRHSLRAIASSTVLVRDVTLRKDDQQGANYLVRQRLPRGKKDVPVIWIPLPSIAAPARHSLKSDKYS